MTLEEAKQMRQELDALAVGITTKLRHLQERGLFDEETRAAATDLQANRHSIASELEEANIESRSLQSRSMIAKEIDALGERLRAWVARVDREYQTHTQRSERSRHRP